MAETHILVKPDGRDICVSVIPRRCDFPSSWLRNDEQATAYASHLSRVHGWLIIDEREVAHGAA